MQAEYWVPDVHVEQLLNRIARINKRAQNLGFPVVKVEQIGSELRPEPSPLPDRPDRQRFWFLYRIIGATPKYQGWTFVAIISPGPIVKTIPGETCPKNQWKRGNVCDQCKLNRHRSNTFVIRHESGSIATVGRNCLQDFLGGFNRDPHKIADWFGHIFDVSVGLGGGEGSGLNARSRTIFPLDEVLRIAEAIMNKHGWVSKGRAFNGGGYATAARIHDFLNPLRNMRPDEQKDYDDIFKRIQLKKVSKKAERVIKWAQKLNPGDSDYLQNLKVIAERSFVDSSTMGLAASMVAAYDREQRQKAEEEEAKKNPSQHVGNIKDRISLIVKPTSFFSTQTNWGSLQIISLVDKNGNIFKWFTGEIPEWMEIGIKVQIKGTVKRHSEYKGIKETHLNRVNQI